MEGMKRVTGVLSRRLENCFSLTDLLDPRLRRGVKQPVGEPAGSQLGGRATSCLKAGLYCSYLQKWARYLGKCLVPVAEYKPS